VTYLKIAQTEAGLAIVLNEEVRELLDAKDGAQVSIGVSEDGEVFLLGRDMSPEARRTRGRAPHPTLKEHVRRPGEVGHGGTVLAGSRRHLRRGHFIEPPVHRREQALGFMAMGQFLNDNGFDLIADQVDATATMLRVARGELTIEQLATWLRTRVCPALDNGP
jgi:hypothetical protein